MAGSDHERTIVKVFLELPCIQCGTHNHNLKILAIASNLTQETTYIVSQMVTETRAWKKKIPYRITLQVFPFKSNYHNKRMIYPYLLQETHENVGCQGALVCFVENNTSISLQKRIVHRLSKQHTVCHVPVHASTHTATIKE